MSWNSVLPALAFFLAFRVSPALSADVCPARNQQPLRFVDVFDGSPEELATLVPDSAKAKSGYWQLGYVYDAGRFVTVRCKYADGHESDIKLSDRVAKCTYKINAKKTLKLDCK